MRKCAPKEVVRVVEVHPEEDLVADKEADMGVEADLEVREVLRPIC